MSEQPVPATKPDDQPIEAGEVGELKDLSFHEAQHQAETARSLATWLVVLLAAGLGKRNRRNRVRSFFLH